MGTEVLVVDINDVGEGDPQLLGQLNGHRIGRVIRFLDDLVQKMQHTLQKNYLAYNELINSSIIPLYQDTPSGSCCSVQNQEKRIVSLRVP